MRVDGLQMYGLYDILLNGDVGTKIANVFIHPKDFNSGQITFYNEKKDIIGEGLVLSKHEDYICIKCNLRCISGILCQACPKQYALKKH